MHLSPLPPTSDNLTAYEAQALLLEDPHPYPQDEALQQLGHALMNEVLDLVTDTALEDFGALICEALICAFHAAAGRIERDADKSGDALNGLIRDFDGSEILDVEIQDATRKARAADVATLALEIIRDARSASYTTATGEVWTACKGAVRASRTTAAQMEARDAIRAGKARRHAVANPGGTIVAFRAAPQADTAEDAKRIFRRPQLGAGPLADMALATSGARGGEKLAIKWARHKGVTLVLAKADFNRNGRAAPFRANDEMLELDPVCVLTLANTLNPTRGEASIPSVPH